MDGRGGPAMDGRGATGDGGGWLSIRPIRRLALAGMAAAVALAVCLTFTALLPGCAKNDAGADGGPTDAEPPVIDLCDAFTGVGSTCPLASPVVCFPMCEAGGCSCSDTPDGPRWGCVTDRSCEQVCAPIDDACATDEGSTDAGPGAAGPGDASSE